MKKILVLAMLMLQAGFGFAADDNTLEFVSFTAAPGEGVVDGELDYEYSTAINLYNTPENEFHGLEFEINVPKGVLIDVDIEGTDRRGFEKKGSKVTYLHGVGISDPGVFTSPIDPVSFDCYNVLIVDQSKNSAFLGESGGSVLFVNYGIPASMEEGEYPVYLTNVKLIYETGDAIKIDQIESKLIVAKDTSVGINGIEGDNAYSKYDLQGRRTNAKTGVLVINGKKQVVK